MADGLDSPRMKLARAIEHFETMKRETDAFMGTDPYALSTNEKVDDVWHVGRLQVRAEPPRMLGTIAGDVVNNVNAALDHLVYERSVTKPDRGTGFPVSLSVSDYALHRDRLLDGVPDWPDRAIIDAYQPYERGMQADPLWLMRVFANADKHRVVQPAFARPHRLRFQLPPGYNANVTVVDHKGPLHDGAELYRLGLIGPPISEGGVKVNARLDLTIGYGDLLIDGNEIGQMLALAKEIIDAF